MILQVFTAADHLRATPGRVIETAPRMRAFELLLPPSRFDRFL